MSGGWLVEVGFSRGDLDDSALLQVFYFLQPGYPGHVLIVIAEVQVSKQTAVNCEAS